MLWSEPALFQVAPGPGERELEEALALVQRYWVLQGDGAGEVKATSADRSARQQKSRAEDGVSTPHLRAPAATDLSVAGGVVAASFTGEGSTLTKPANLSAGDGGDRHQRNGGERDRDRWESPGGAGVDDEPAECANLRRGDQAESLAAHALVLNDPRRARLWTRTASLQTGRLVTARGLRISSGRI